MTCFCNFGLEGGVQGARVHRPCMLGLWVETVDSTTTGRMQRHCYCIQCQASAATTESAVRRPPPEAAEGSAAAAADAVAADGSAAGAGAAALAMWRARFASCCSPTQWLLDFVISAAEARTLKKPKR